MKRYYKLAQPDGFDFFTGKTINYRDCIGKTVKPPSPDYTKGLCSNGMIHASGEPNKCFIGAAIPCSAYIVKGTPHVCDSSKCGFTELKVIEEIFDLNKLFGWNYAEACNPINPLALPKATVGDEQLSLLRQWSAVGSAVGNAIWSAVGSAVWNAIWSAVWSAVESAVGAYAGSLFPIQNYEFQPAANLWRMGLVPSFDGEFWRLHSGADAGIVWEGQI